VSWGHASQRFRPERRKLERGVFDPAKIRPPPDGPQDSNGRAKASVTTCDTPLAKRGACPAPMMQGVETDGGRQVTSALLHTICRQRSAERGPPHGGMHEAVTTCDTPLAKRGAHAPGPARMGQGVKTDGGRQATSALLYTISRQHSAERGLPHDGRREAVTACDSRWRSAERAPCLHGA
jgi:hypothetical protein